MLYSFSFERVLPSSSLIHKQTVYTFGRNTLNVFVWKSLITCFDRVSLHSPGWPGTCYVDQAGPFHRDLPVSTSLVLGLHCVPPHLANFVTFDKCVIFTAKVNVMVHNNTYGCRPDSRSTHSKQCLLMTGLEWHTPLDRLMPRPPYT